MKQPLKHKPEIVPQAMAARIVGKPRQRVSELLKAAGRLQTFDVYGEKWVSVTELRHVIATPGKAGRPRKVVSENRDT